MHVITQAAKAEYESTCGLHNFQNGRHYKGFVWEIQVIDSRR